MIFEMLNGNIVDVAADAIVLPANPELKEGPGASKAIFEAAGRKKLAKACAEKVDKNPGLAVITPAFDIPAKCIVHAIVPKWIDGKHNEYESLCAAYIAALDVADYLECESIAFPLLASGHNGFDKEMAIKIATDSIEDYEPKHLKKAIIIIYGTHTVELVRSMGYKCQTIAKLEPDAGESKTERIKEKGADLAGKFVDKAIDISIAKASEFLLDEKTIKSIFVHAGKIVKNIVKKKHK